MADWLGAALNEYQPGEYPWRDDEPALDEVTQGDVLVVADMDGRGPNRLVVVLDIDPERRCFHAAFFTNEQSFATAEDVILPTEDSGLPYRIAGQAGLTGWIWYVQVRRRVGALSDEASDAVSAGHCGVDDEFQRAHRGIPLQSQACDLRWPHLEAELEAITELTRDCARKRNDEHITLPFVDPRMLPLPSNAFDTFEAETLDLLVKATQKGRTRGFSPSCVEQVIERLDRRDVLAYRSLLSTGPVTTNPPPRDDRKRDVTEWLLELTKADGLSQAPYVKVIGTHHSPTSQVIEHNGRRAEYLYEIV